MNKSKFQTVPATAGNVGACDDVWGLIESDPEGTWLVAPREILDQALGVARFSARTAMGEIKRGGFLKCEADKLTVRRQLPGGERVPCYVIRLNDGDDDEPTTPQPVTSGLRIEV